MGAYSSKLQPSSSSIMVASFSHPSKADWIPAHATTTELAIPEVERLWMRFQQLGANKEGILTEQALQTERFTKDAFIKNIVTHLHNDDGAMTFQTFLVAVKWFEIGSMDNRLRENVHLQTKRRLFLEVYHWNDWLGYRASQSNAVFHLLNNGSPVASDMLIRILQKVYPDKTLGSIQKTAGIVMKQIGAGSPGEITEDQFTTWCGRLNPDEVQDLLNFKILPSDISQDAQDKLTEFQRSVSVRSARDPTREIPSDEILRDVSEKIYRRDWYLLGNKLGFLQNDIDSLVSEYRANPKEQVYQILVEWRRREGSAAYAHVLEKALRDVGMTDASLILSP